MTELLLLTALFLLAAVAFLVTLREIVHDGYGHRPPPASHPADLFDPVAQRSW